MEPVPRRDSTCFNVGEDESVETFCKEGASSSLLEAEGRGKIGGYAPR
jgi:hypothetical protein